MREDKELQKKLKSTFETPDTPFNEWADKRGIFADATAKVECPVCVPVDNVNGRSMPNGNKKKILIICASFVALILAVVIILITVLPRPFVPKIYGENDTLNFDIEFNEILQTEDIYLFDMKDEEKPELVTKSVLIEDNSQVMLYTLLRCLVSVENGEIYDGFYITYRIRTYENYEFVGCQTYDKLNISANINDLKVSYIIDNKNNPIAYASFSVGEYEYFIEAYGYEGVTVLNEDNFINLLNKILI
ncbi:MAG: hypothetical protein K2O89_07830 [Clostridia bacterium]|nr:hypothetical protein [Clostridia bacterium]